MRQWLYLGLAVVLFAAASLLIPGVNKMREQHGLTANPVLENVPPELALATTALGGFRGIIVDILWMRAMRLQQENKFFELVQLFDWIGKLEPRSASVWVFAAWNMAYNVSVEMPTAPERWRWIELGISRLRDYGLRYDARSPKIYQELAWIFQHKIGSNIDDFHWYYKTMLAIQVEDIFGRGPVTDLRPYLKAPRTLAELRKKLDPEPIFEQLKNAGYKPLEDPVSVLRDLDEEKSRARAVLDKPEFTHARKTFVMFLRNWAIQHVLKLDLDYMQARQKDIGPMDWRLPDPFSIYYVEKALEYTEKGEFTANLRRIKNEAVRRLYKKGSLFFDRGKKGQKPVYLTTANWRFFDKANQVYLDAIKAEPNKNIKQSLKSAHAGFLEEAVLLFYINSKVQRAIQLFNELKKRYPTERLNVPFEDFIVGKVIPDPILTSQEDAKASVDGVLLEAYRWYAAGDDERAEGLFGLARLMWKSYMKEKTGRYGKRLGLPPFKKMQEEIQKKVLRPGTLPELLRQRLRDRLGLTEKPARKEG